MALGVSGSWVLVPEHAVDLEAAIAFAPALADIDPRLHDEVLDWCIQFGHHFVSVTCLKHCLRSFEATHVERFNRFAAIVNAHSGAKWPASIALSRFEPSGKSKLKLDRPASVHLRARKIFGINARADIVVGLTLLGPTPDPRWTHINLLLDLGYSKRALNDAFNDLALGGLLGTLRFGNTIRYALKNEDALRSLLAPIPARPGQPWAQRLAVAASLLDVERRTREKSATTHAVEVRKVIERHRKDLERSGTFVPDIRTGDPWPEINAWIATLLRP